jgi:hypothetical protein
VVCFEIATVAFTSRLSLGLPSPLRAPFAGWSGSARFALFVVVAGSAGLLFRDVVSLVYPFLQGVPGLDPLVSFLGGLIMLGAIVWVWIQTKPDLSVLSSRAGQVSRPSEPPRV